MFSRRKLESNWDRYEESERQEPDDDTPSQRGADYHVLLQSAGELTRLEEQERQIRASASHWCTFVFK